MRSCWHSAGERSAQRWRRGGELTHKRRKAPGADTRGPPGWEPDLKWRGWGAEIPPPEPSVLARSCSVAGGVKKRLTRWRSEPETASGSVPWRLQPSTQECDRQGLFNRRGWGSSAGTRAPCATGALFLFDRPERETP